MGERARMQGECRRKDEGAKTRAHSGAVGTRTQVFTRGRGKDSIGNFRILELACTGHVDLNVN